MNADLSDDNPVIDYYDSDYPSPFNNPYPDNFDKVTEFQGLQHDISRYKEIAAEVGSPILDLCCGTGRISLPLASDGHRVTAVDISKGMLRKLRENVSNWPDEVDDRIEPVHADITALDLPNRQYALAIIAFNSLLCITSFASQQQALAQVANHLKNGGLLILDVVNPLQLTLSGSAVPKPFFTRTNVGTGRRYTRFAMSDPIDAEQRQRLHGWYDEIRDDGSVVRTAYSMHWRPIFRYELELMLRAAGFGRVVVEGGHRKEPFQADSAHMFYIATRN